MSSVVISGDTSGSVTLAAPAVAGTNTITLPASTGTVVTTGTPAIGNVIQVVQATTTTGSSTTSATYVTTGFSASITPKFSSSKIMVIVGGNIDNQTSGIQGDFNIYRGSTPLSTNGFTMGYNASARTQMPMHINYLDSPSTTSSTTYTLYFAVSAGSGSLTFNGASGIGVQTATITLMEIAA